VGVGVGVGVGLVGGLGAGLVVGVGVGVGLVVGVGVGVGLGLTISGAGGASVGVELGSWVGLAASVGFAVWVGGSVAFASTAMSTLTADGATLGAAGATGVVVGVGLEVAGTGLTDGLGDALDVPLWPGTVTVAPFGCVVDPKYEPATVACEGGDTKAFEPTRMTLAVATVVMPTREMAATSVFVDVAASAAGRWKLAPTFMAPSPPDRPSATRDGTQGLLYTDGAH
jgi:hypothetical protein